MKSKGYFISVVGSILCIAYPPFLNGSYSGYAYIFQTYETIFGTMRVIDAINFQQLGLQLIVVNIIGFGLAIIGTLQEKKESETKSERKAKIAEFDFLKEELLNLYESEPEKYENNSALLKTVSQLKTMDEYDFDLELNESMKTMLSVLKTADNAN
ncbi:hypothetical protein [Vibrio sp. 10N]|uniref:hypothetical protein n=1 Tax=Vibrio sp. 10N TaxID=3058938 RepID=UPI0028133201|nr:hypothetical protein VB10N_17280 [Vibrio sp. 10N]